ncbi:MAG TPA: 2-dehydropantoate 2-reductase [Vicinamibacteria bacterium]|nr:2-dehydropantoate 2-reductase [Vicinamibacteria bacterium]
MNTPPSRPTRVLVLGTGAMACAVGARVARFGRAAVTLAGTWEAALDTIAARGIVVEEPAAVWSAKVDVAPLAGPFGPVDVVLVLVKSHRTAAVARTAARALLPESIAVTLQTGLGNVETLEAACGQGRVAVGVATLAAHLLGPGEVRVSPGRVVVGDGAAGASRLIDLLAAARLEPEVSAGIDRFAWSRLAVACAIDPLSALTGRPIGTLLEVPEPCDTLLKSAREVGAVALARGIDLGDPASLAVEAAESSAARRSAMSHDLDRGALTEVDAQSGAVGLEGRRLGVPTPVNDYLWQRIREKEGRPVRLPAGPAPS